MYTWVDSEQETSGDKTSDTHIEEEWRQQTLLEEANRHKQLNIQRVQPISRVECTNS